MKKFTMLFLVGMLFFVAGVRGGEHSCYAQPLNQAAYAKNLSSRQEFVSRKQNSAQYAKARNNSFSFSMHQGLAVGSSKMNEYVYIEDGSTISHLIWETNPYALVNLGASLQNARLGFHFDGFWKLAEFGGKMDDFDWLIIGADWTHHSWHDDVPITSAYSYDLNMSYVFSQSAKFEMEGVAGYKREHLKMEARGGKYIYSTVDSLGNLHFRDKKGTFLQNVLCIAYEQTWNAVYLGLGMGFNLRPNVKMKGRVVYAPWAFGSAIDDHALRNLTTKDEVETTMIGGNFGIEWLVRNNLAFSIDYAYEKYKSEKGNGSYYFAETDTDPAKISYGIDNIGMGFETSRFGINLEYTF